MAPKTTKRRSPHEGGAYSYQTKAGILWYWKATVAGPDGTAKPRVKRGFTTKQAALAGLREALSASSKGGYAEPSKQPTGDYLATWLDGLRLAPSTVASYRKNVRLHIAPHIGSVPLASLTPVVLDRLYRQLEPGGRADHRQGEGLSASDRSLRPHDHQLGAPRCGGRRAAARQPGQPGAPADRQAGGQPRDAPVGCPAARRVPRLGAPRTANCPRPGTCSATPACAAAKRWALRWRDVDLDAATITVRRSAGLIRTKGEGAEVKEGPTKTGKPRVVDLDPGTEGVLRAWKRDRGALWRWLARDDSLVFGDINGHHRQPEHFSRTWNQTVARAIRDGIDIPEDPAS